MSLARIGARRVMLIDATKPVLAALLGTRRYSCAIHHAAVWPADIPLGRVAVNSS